MSSMKAAVYYNNSDVRIEEVPLPVISDGELLVKIMASGICGSDVMEWYRIKKAPLILGHEVAGEIVETGKNVEKFKVGDYVTVAHHVPCNTCRHCLSGNHSLCNTIRSTNFDPGGFCEFVRVPAINVDRGTFKLPKAMSFEEGSFSEALACVLRGQKIAGMSAGKTVLVIGSGLSGLLHIQLAKASGASMIVATDISDYRLMAAENNGANAAFRADVFNENKLREINNGQLADIVILCAGVESALHQGIKCTERGGTLLLFAPFEPETKIPIDLWNIWRDQITIKSTYAGPPAETAESLNMISSGLVDVKKLITHRLPLDKAAEGFGLTARADKCLKVIIEPHS